MTEAEAFYVAEQLELYGIDTEQVSGRDIDFGIKWWNAIYITAPHPCSVCADDTRRYADALKRKEDVTAFEGRRQQCTVERSERVREVHGKAEEPICRVCCHQTYRRHEREAQLHARLLLVPVLSRQASDDASEAVITHAYAYTCIHTHAL